MKKILKNALIGLFAGGLMFNTACTDLDETLYDQLNDTNVDLTSPDDLGAMMGQAIANYRYMNLSWFGYWELAEQCTDQYMVPFRIGIGWGDLYVNLHKHDWNYNLGHAENIWYYAYKCIGYCNLVLDNMSEEQVADRAQLRFFRAMTYYQMFDILRNVPIETTMAVEPGYLPAQSGTTFEEGAKAVYDFCVSELEDIKTEIGRDKHFGYGNEFVVRMALAKLYLNYNAYFGTTGNDYYELALDEASVVIDEGGYVLSEKYSDNFREELGDNQEIIFAIPQDRTHATHFLLHTYAFPQVGLEAYGSTATATNGSCAVPQFIDTYDVDDSRLYETWAMGQQHYAVKNADGTYTPNAGDPIPYDEDDWAGQGILTYSNRVHAIDVPGAYKQEGYRMHKYEVVADRYGTSSVDMPVFRLADAMFIKAECLLRLGRDKQTAADLVTEVRKRAFPNSVAKATRTVADLEAGSVYEYGLDYYPCEGYNNWETHTTTYEGGDDVELGGLYDDLGWEFVGEMHRRQDMIRFKLKDGRNVYNGKSYFCKTATTETHWDVFPIPEAVLRANISLKQNPGYTGAE